MITGRISAERILKQCMASSAATVFVAALGSAAHARSKARQPIDPISLKSQ